MENSSVEFISLSRFLYILVPVLIVVAILFKWSLDGKNAIYALLRMLVQLLLIGYCLTFIFNAESSWLVILVLLIMLLASSWIALGTVKAQRKSHYIKALIAIAIGGIVTLITVTQGVLQLEPWYLPEYMIPLAGMTFANAMISVSLAAERLYAEIERENEFAQAKNIAMKAAMIPIINSLFAVGLVSLPGMMTGQVLSGISPLIAVRYQIMVMLMIFASAGVSTACYLFMLEKDMDKKAAISPS